MYIPDFELQEYFKKAVRLNEKIKYEPNNRIIDFSKNKYVISL